MSSQHSKQKNKQGKKEGNNQRNVRANTHAPFWLRALPNTLTIFRFFLIAPYLFFLFLGNFKAAAVVYVVALLSDLDGVIARKYNVTSKTGAVLDPTVDGIFMTTGLVSLSALGLVSPWAAGIYFVGALFRLLPSLVHLKKTQTVKSTLVSKTIAFCGYASVLLGTIGTSMALTSTLLVIGFAANVFLTLSWFHKKKFQL